MVFGFLSNLLFGTSSGHSDNQNSRREERRNAYQIEKVVPVVKPKPQEYIRNSSSQLYDSRSELGKRSVSPNESEQSRTSPTKEEAQFVRLRAKSSTQTNSKPCQHRLSYAEKNANEFERPRSQISLPPLSNIFTFPLVSFASGKSNDTITPENSLDPDMKVFDSVETEDGVHDSLDTTKSDQELKILDSDEADLEEERIKEEKREKKRRDRASIIQKITREHKEQAENFEEVFEPIPDIYKDKTTEFIESYDRLAEMAGRSHAERRQKILSTRSGKDEEVDGIQSTKIINENNQSKKNNLRDVTNPSMVVPKIRPSSGPKLRNARVLSESFQNPRCVSMESNYTTPSILSEDVMPTEEHFHELEDEPKEPAGEHEYVHVQKNDSFNPTRHATHHSTDNNFKPIYDQKPDIVPDSVSGPEKAVDSGAVVQKVVMRQRSLKKEIVNEIAVDVPTQELVSDPEPSFDSKRGSKTKGNISFQEIDSRILKDYHTQNDNSFKPLVRTESAPMKMDEFAMRKMKADHGMSQWTKLRIALGNAILPNVPQSQEELYRVERTKRYVEQQRQSTEINKHNGRLRPVSMGSDRISDDHHSGNNLMEKEDSTLTRSTINFSSTEEETKQMKITEKHNGVKKQNGVKLRNGIKNINGVKVPSNGIKVPIMSESVPTALPVKSGELPATSRTKKRPLSGFSFRLRKNRDEHIAASVPVDLEKKGDRKLGFLEGVKMKKRQNQRRLSHAIIQNTNKVKEKVKDSGIKTKDDNKEKDIDEPELITQKKFEKTYLRASREVLKNELATAKPPENATRVQKMKRAFSEMVIFAKPGEKYHHMHHPWARRALQDVILIPNDSNHSKTASAVSIANKQPTLHIPDSPKSEERRKLRNSSAHKENVSVARLSDSKSSASEGRASNRSKDSNSSSTDSKSKPPMIRSVSTPVQESEIKRRITSQMKPELSRSTSLQTEQRPKPRKSPLTQSMSATAEEAEDKFPSQYGTPQLGPRISALSPAIQKNISVVQKPRSRLSSVANKCRRSSSLTKLENFKISLGPQNKPRAATYVRLAMRRTSSALGLNQARRLRSQQSTLVKETQHSVEIGPFSLNKKTTDW